MVQKPLSELRPQFFRETPRSLDPRLRFALRSSQPRPAVGQRVLLCPGIREETAHRPAPEERRACGAPSECRNAGSMASREFLLNKISSRAEWLRQSLGAFPEDEAPC